MNQSHKTFMGSLNNYTITSTLTFANAPGQSGSFAKTLNNFGAQMIQETGVFSLF